MRDNSAALENIVWLSICLIVRKLLSYSKHTAYFIELTSTIHLVDTDFTYAVFKQSFSKQYKI